MNPFFNHLLAFVGSHLATLAATVLGTIAATLLAYFRAQVSAGTKWLFAPITQRLPWNQTGPIVAPSIPNREGRLRAELIVVDVFLMSSDGRTAGYQKTANYIVDNGFVRSYWEAVTGTGKVGALSTLVGTIAETKREHGFYVSRIDLADLLSKDFRFQNVFTAELNDCFTNTTEHWTQEITRPTEHLTLRIHFPASRPPKVVKCKIVEGVSSRQLKTDAKITELLGKPGIVWDIHPKLKEVYKLEWVW